MRPPGRPQGDVRQALVQALHAGASGTWEALAHHVGVDPRRTRYALWHMQRDGSVAVLGKQCGAGAGRPRTVYSMHAGAPQLDPLRYTAQVWR